MSVILILILASLAVALAFLAGFIWAVKVGQFEDTCTPAMRILSEDEAGKQAPTEAATARDAGCSLHTTLRREQQASGSPSPPLEERAGERRPRLDAAVRGGISAVCGTNSSAALAENNDLLSLPLASKGGVGNGTAANDYLDAWKEQGARALRARR